MIDWGWVSRELGAAGGQVSEPPYEAVVMLLQIMEKYELNDAEKDFVISSFGSLVRGHSLPRLNEEFENWKSCQAGDYMIGDTVRVKSSGYSGEHGMWHNGKRGKIIGTRNNSVVVRYDEESAEDARHHSPDVLEVLVP